MDRDLRIRMILQAADRVTGPLRDIAGGSTRAAQALRTAREGLAGINRQQADIAGFRALRRGISQTSVELKQARAALAAARGAIASTDQPTRAMTRALQQAERQMTTLRRRGTEEANQLRELRTRMEAAGVSTRDLARHERDLADRARRATSEIQEQERRVGQLAERQRRMAAAREGFTSISDRAGGVAAAGASALATGAVVAAPLLGVTKGAMDLEEGMAGVAKVTGMADAQLAGMREKLVNLSTRMPMTAVDLSQIAAAAGAAGVGMDKFGRPLPSQADDLVAFTDAAARMGIAFDMTAEDAGSTMAKWRQAFKMTQPEVEMLGDRINALTNKFGGNATSVAGIVTRIGPLGKVAGIAAPQVSALASSLNSIGVEEEVAATGIKSLLLNLTKGAAATKSQRGAFKSLGLDAEQLARSMQVDASGTIVSVLEKIGGLSTDRQASILSEVFGTESVGAIAPLLTNLDGVKERLSLVGDRSKYAGSMTAEFASRISTAKGITDVARNSIAAVALTLGQSLLPMVKSGALRLGAIALRMRAFAAAHPQLAKVAMIATAILAGLFTLFGIGAIMIAGIMGPIAILNAGLIAMGVAGGVAALPLLPILAAVAAIAGAIALVVAAFNHWDTITGIVAGIWNTVRTNFLSNIAYLASLPSRFVDVGKMMMRGLVDGLLSGLKWVLSTVTGIAGKAAGAFRSALGIHSPSRLFAGFGGFMMEGLAGGITAGERQPIKRVETVARRLAGAMAVGTIAPTMAMADPGSVRGTAAAGIGGRGSAMSSRYEIHIHQQPGQSSQDLARAVADELDRREREAAARARGTMADRPDWEDG